MSIEDMANRQAIEFMEKTKDTAGLEAFKEAAELNSEKNVAQWAENALKRLSQETEIAKTTPEYQTTQLEKLNGSNEEIIKRTEEVDSNIELVKTNTENKIKKLNEEAGEYVPFEEIKNEEKNLDNLEKLPEEKVEQKIENKDEVVESTETLKEKPLEIGDEVYKDGIFYKVHDFEPEYNIEMQNDYLDKKNNNQIKPGESQWEWEARRKKELDAEGIKAPRKMRLVITEGGVGGEKGAFEENLDESQITRVTPELREKILKMKKESGRGEQFAARG